MVRKIAKKWETPRFFTNFDDFFNSSDAMVIPCSSFYEAYEWK
jgi:hypothetical protein